MGRCFAPRCHTLPPHPRAGSRIIASIFKEKNAWHLRFYLRDSPYKRSLGAISEHKVHRAKQRVEARLAHLKAGFLKLPDDADLAEFIIRGQVIPTPEARASKETFLSVRDSYLEYAEPRRAPTSLATEHVHLRHFDKFLGERVTAPIEEIEVADIERYATERRHKVTGTTVNKEDQTLRQLFDHAVRLGAVEANLTCPVKRFKRSASEQHRFMTKSEIDEEVERAGLTEKEIKRLYRFRYLTNKEVEGLLELARKQDAWLYRILVALAYTGMRRGEVVQPEWADVDFKANKIWVKSRKQSRTRESTTRDIDMHEELHTMLAEQREAHPAGRCVFPDEGGAQTAPRTLHRRFKALVKGTDFEGIGLHCLEHSFAGNLAASGVDGRLIDHYMGHQAEAMRRRYQHLFPEKKKEGIAAPKT